MNNNKIITITLFFFITFFYFLLINSTGKRYNWYLPTIIFLYPNCLLEVKDVIEQTNNKTKKNISFFYLTDSSVVHAFIEHFPEFSFKELENISRSQNAKILFLKKFINRPRPKQISNKVKLLVSKTANTPAFPAGHAAQAYILANYLTEIYPEKKTFLENIADECNSCRVKAGLHYPSDGLYSKLIFYKYNSQ